jgi:hypothetical protein
MTPTRSAEEPSAAQWPFVTHTMTPPVSVLGGHVVENFSSCLVGKRPEETLTDMRVRVGDRSRGARRPSGVEHLGGGVEIESGHQRREIAIGEPMHCARRRTELHQMPTIGGEMQV